MKTTAAERRRWRRDNVKNDAPSVCANDEIRLLDDVDELLARKRALEAALEKVQGSVMVHADRLIDIAAKRMVP